MLLLFCKYRFENRFEILNGRWTHLKNSRGTWKISLDILSLPAKKWEKHKYLIPWCAIFFSLEMALISSGLVADILLYRVIRIIYLFSFVFWLLFHSWLPFKIAICSSQWKSFLEFYLLVVRDTLFLDCQANLVNMIEIKAESIRKTNSRSKMI